MKKEILECRVCRYRWIPRVKAPKECPNCKHRFAADWGKKPKVVIRRVKSKEEWVELKEELRQWNDKGRWEAD